ncbi:hypothetical protein [Guptibacillus hwajinpoensis]|uniref:hypothetical protein n=1 Tax=Guptibacillus hwajinpoensis TaxID=208199 RepID=UPI001CFCB5C9|nr:hypothetical protein [Pseudalkalibacillus hwajinpoensis]WLR57893.1 hypothetical protein LC071_11295 [Pseudalkalibacillus hwajinpoensis]
MFLLFLIVASSVVGLLLLPLHEIGLIIAFGMIVGCLLRGLYLLHEINRKLDRNDES